MKTVNKCLFILAACVSLCSCSENEDELEQVGNHVDLFQKTTAIDGIEYTVQYRPMKEILQQEEYSRSDDSASVRRKADLYGTVWFNLIMKKVSGNNSPLREGINSLEEYQSRYNYFLSEAAGDLLLTYNGISVKPMSYTFETTYNLTPQEIMVIGFYLPGGDSIPKHTMQLSYLDRIFNNGIIKATFTKAVLD